MFNKDDEITTEDELLEDDLLDDSVPDELPDRQTPAEEAGEGHPEGVVWTRGENGRLERVL